MALFAPNSPVSATPLQLRWFLLHFLLIFAARASTGAGDKLPLPRFSVGWADDRSEFRAGDVAMIKVRPWGDANNTYDEYTAEFSVEVRGKKGNSSFVSGVRAYSDGDPAFWNITFVPITAGEFSMIVTEERFGASDSSLHFTVLAGRVHASACLASWMNDINEFVAGTAATVVVHLNDAFGNNISSTSEGVEPFANFKVLAYHENGSVVNISDFNQMGLDSSGYVSLQFVFVTAGNFLLHILSDNMAARGSPLPFKVKPGSLVVSKCIGKWKYETNALQIFSRLEFFVYQQDQYGNMVSGSYSFDAQIIKKGANLSVPVEDMLFSEFEPGIQLLSFAVSEPGEFILVVFDRELNESIFSAPHEYTVFVGYCNGISSIVNGSGIVASVAGQLSYFTVCLEDLYHNPSPIEVERLHVRIHSLAATVSVSPVIFPLRNLNDGNGTVPVPPLNHNYNLAAESTVLTNAFNVTYTPELAGKYEIWVFCGNIPLNSGHPFLMTAFPAVVDKSSSRVVGFVPRVKRLVKNEIVVQLVDSFANPVLSQESKLSFRFDSDNSLRFLMWKFVGAADGLYIGYYLARDLGAYKPCVSFEDAKLSPCPFEVNVHQREYFPEAVDDNISVWEDGSVAFDVLENDYCTGHARIINSSTPVLGSLLRYGDLFRYTPYKGISGNDSFCYTISDINNNVATAVVSISVLCLPPQFVSLPDHLVVPEDVLTPQFGGFTGFLIKYSDSLENISIKVQAHSGTIFLAPMPLELGQQLGSNISVINGGRDGKDLQLAGNVDIINSALQLIQYLGDENFYGNDILSLYAMNQNGMQDAHLPIFVEPINDPPFIHVPKVVVLESNGTGESLQIFNSQRDFFEFSIGDPDFLNFPGNRSHFLVTLSMELNNGMLISRLPVGLLNTVELKMRTAYHWQHLQSFVTISNHFIVKGKGIRIRGSIEECNDAMKQLFYQDVEQGAVLSIIVNDMGNYGCHSDCLKRTTLPLSTEFAISLIKRKPIGSVEAHILGSAIIIEFILMLLLGGILLFFICKCTNALHSKRNHPDSAIKQPEREGSIKTPPNASLSSEYFARCSKPISFKGETSNFRQRSCRAFKWEKLAESTHQQSGPSTCVSFSVERARTDDSS